MACSVHVDSAGGGRVSFEWTDPAAQRELSRALLATDWGIPHWSCPATNLCPPVRVATAHPRTASTWCRARVCVGVGVCV
ncbi:DUF890 domain-containing protein, partial [archaeon]